MPDGQTDLESKGRIQGNSPSPMDRQLAPKRFTRNKVVFGIAIVLVAILVFAAVNEARQDGRTYAINAERVSISEVRFGKFSDDIPVRGQVTPLTTVYLDAVEGGQVTAVFIEEGAFVTAGQKLVALNNTDLQLEVLGREAQVTEQLNSLRNTSLALEQNRLGHKRDLIEVEYQIVRLERLLDRRRPLMAAGTVSRQGIEELEDELAYFTARRAVTLEAAEQDELFRAAQVTQLEESVESLRANLVIARENLSNLVVSAPISGQVTALDAHVGESRARGQRLGQIDQVDRYKVTAWVDEFYVTRVASGQTGSFSLHGSDYTLSVVKTYPEVVTGQFKVDLAFVDDAPQELRRGQTLQVRLALDAPTESLIIDNGVFFQQTGGTWVFVVDTVSGDAVRRPVRLGRRTTREIEVLDGLVDGDRVVTSSYETFADMDRLVFDG